MANLMLDAALPRAAAVKINVAFFEAFGSAGIAALERVRARIPDDVPFIADAKRGDIGTTVARQAAALYDVAGRARGHRQSRTWAARRSRRCSNAATGSSYVLCRTSNPGAGELQDLDIDGAAALHRTSPSDAALWAADRANVGLVVGATAPQELEQDQARPFRSSPFLVPGVGAQGGDIDAVMSVGPVTKGRVGSARSRRSLLVNVSRGIAARRRWTVPIPEAAVAAAAAQWATQPPVLGCRHAVQHRPVRASARPGPGPAGPRAGQAARSRQRAWARPFASSARHRLMSKRLFSIEP